MTNTEDLQDQLQNALNELDDAKTRIGQLEADVKDVTALAIAYKDVNTRLEEKLRAVTHCVKERNAAYRRHENGDVANKCAIDSIAHELGVPFR